jgi:hypothetical protein
VPQPITLRHAPRKVRSNRKNENVQQQEEELGILEKHNSEEEEDGATL